jgi:hypothetical protein
LIIPVLRENRMTTTTAQRLGNLFTRPSDPLRSRARIAAVANLLDSAFVIPGTNVRVGLDPLIGLLPIAGDAVTTVLSCYIVYEGHRAGLPKSALLRMAANIAIDAAISNVPVLGDIGDIFWRANQRNLAIFDDYLARRRSGAIVEGKWRAIER